MTRFCTWNIPTLFGLKFLSSVVSIAENCFGRVMTTFSGSSPTRVGKVENRAWMTQFAPETYPHNLWWYSYGFESVQLKNVSAEFWRLLEARVPQQLEKLKIGLGRLDFAPETYRHCLGCNSYRFTWVRSKNVSVELWQLFGFGDHRSNKSWKQAVDDSV